jgi:SET domain-containing protein
MDMTDSADSIIRLDSKLKSVYVASSKIEGAGDGLFARKQISRGQPVVVYYGAQISNDDLYDLYRSDPDAHKEANRFIRGTPNGFSINGEKSETSVLQGVYVNDVACISCSKDDISRDILQEYADTIKKCNLKTVDTSDYPVYVATKRIKKKEELYAHYGIGYWLMSIGYSPEDLTVLNQVYKFNSFYQ